MTEEKKNPESAHALARVMWTFFQQPRFMVDGHIISHVNGIKNFWSEPQRAARKSRGEAIQVFVYPDALKPKKPDAPVAVVDPVPEKLAST